MEGLRSRRAVLDKMEGPSSPNFRGMPIKATSLQILSPIALSDTSDDGSVEEKEAHLNFLDLAGPNKITNYC